LPKRVIERACGACGPGQAAVEGLPKLARIHLGLRSVDAQPENKP
jgi:hypothetical protein